MPNLIEKGAEWLAGQLVCNASYPAMYCRGGDTVTLNAVPGSSARTLSDELGGVRLLAIEDDWLVRVCDLRLMAGFAEPLIGDTIVIKSGPKKGTFTVFEPSPGVPHAERVNVGTMWRCHTKRTKGPQP